MGGKGVQRPFAFMCRSYKLQDEGVTFKGKPSRVPLLQGSVVLQSPSIHTALSMGRLRTTGELPPSGILGTPGSNPDGLRMSYLPVDNCCPLAFDFFSVSSTSLRVVYPELAERLRPNDKGNNSE